MLAFTNAGAGIRLRHPRSSRPKHSCKSTSKAVLAGSWEAPQNLRHSGKLTSSDLKMDPNPNNRKRNLYLDYNWTPVTEEVSNLVVHNASIEGQVPKDLRGRLYRIGPNARYLPEEGQRINWFDGDGMIHVVALDNNEEDQRLQISYFNRWVQSSFFKQELCFQRPSLNITALRGIRGLLCVLAELIRLFIQGAILGFKYTEDRIDSLSPLGVANTNLLFRGGSIYALYESDGPWKLNPVSLTTEGFNDRDLRPQGVKEPYCAHPKIAPNGDLISFSILFRPGPAGGMIVYVNNPDDRSRDRRFKVPNAYSYTHDICVSQNFIIFMDSPCRVDFANMLHGGGPLRWDYNGKSRIGVIPRDETGMMLLGLTSINEVKWFDLDQEDTGFVFHWGNGFNDQDSIIACGSLFDVFDISFLDEEIPQNYNMLPKMSDFRIDLKSGRVRRLDVLKNDDFPIRSLSDFPVWRQSLTGSEHQTRFLYGSFAFFEANRSFVGPGDCVPPDGQLATIGGLAGYFKYDLTDPQAPKVKRISFPRDVNGGECCFVPKPGSTEEDDGYLLGIVTYLPKDSLNPAVYADAYRSYLWIFDAKFSEIENLAKFDKSNPYRMIGDVGISDPPKWVGYVPGLIASVQLPSRVPWGLHTLFLPDEMTE